MLGSNDRFAGAAREVGVIQSSYVAHWDGSRVFNV